MRIRAHTYERWGANKAKIDAASGREPSLMVADIQLPENIAMDVEKVKAKCKDLQE